MQVIYETYRRHKNNNSNKNTNLHQTANINNNNNINYHNKNDHNNVDLIYNSQNVDFNTNNNSAATNHEPTDIGHANLATYRHIISVESLIINKKLGVGEFGVVQQGVWTNEDGQRIQVAIKCLSTDRLENSRIEFLKEANIMHSISHEHIVTLYGVVLEPSFMLITELAPLRSLLECLKEPELITHFPLTSLCTFASQIADGMAYLESKRLIHRDLAARNILVFSKEKVKISDFGLSRALGVGKDYYQSNFNVNLKLPIAWCAPECINYLKFTSQSDVWAYGVTLWEMFSFGFQPWAALTGQQILEAIDKPNFQRLEKPECCPKEYYQLMLKCWTHEPNLRPKFSEIFSLLPDCKPELLQAIHNSSNVIRKDLLSYKSGDIVTVIDKNSEYIEGSKESFWKGITNERKTGLFNPSDFVAYLGQNLPSSSQTSNYSSNSFVQSLWPGSNSNGNHSSLASTITSTVLQSSKFFRGFLDNHKNHTNNNSPYGSRKSRLRPEMISRPQGDLKHTGHVGPDGYFFGDIAFIDVKSNQPVSNKNRGNETTTDKKSRKLTISNPITNYNTNNLNSMNNDKVVYSNHEYHEISDEDENCPLESPPFEVFDFGPSLMEEVFKELDHIKPDLNNDAAESETAINENSINVKNEVRELNLKMKETNNLKKKQSSVKSISETEQIELDHAIAMARTMLEDDLDHSLNDSPKTPNSPNRKKFSFKFPTTHRSPKSERRTFCETQYIGNIIESITPAAKEAYMSLVQKGVSGSCASNIDPPSPTISSLNNETDNNSLRTLKTANIGKLLQPKIRGNRSVSQPRLPTTPQTAGLARVALSRSPPGLSPNMPYGDDQSIQNISSQMMHSNSNNNNNNALPLPPRDRSRPLIQLKTHQRRHPLVIPAELCTINDTLNSSHVGKNIDESIVLEKNKHDSPPVLHRHVPVLKQVSCPQAPAAFLNNVYNKTNNMNNNNQSSDNLTDSLEKEMEKAFDNIKLTSQYCNGNSPNSSKDNVSGNSTINQKSLENNTSNKNNLETINNDGSFESSFKLPESMCTISENSDKINGNKRFTNTSSSSNNNIQNKQRNINSDEVRVMQKVLSNELTDEECLKFLDSTDWDIHKAIKCIRLRQQLRSHNINVDCNWSQMLSKFNWNMRQASNYLIATQGVPEDTTEV